jgi:hypothetical protein
MTVRILGRTCEVVALWAVITARATRASRPHRVLFPLSASVCAIGAIFHNGSYFSLRRGSSVAMQREMLSIYWLGSTFCNESRSYRANLSRNF